MGPRGGWVAWSLYLHRGSYGMGLLHVRCATGDGSTAAFEGGRRVLPRYTQTWRLAHSQPSQAPALRAVLREAKVAECKGDAMCEQKAIDSTQAALDQQQKLDACLNYAFSGSEKRMCQMQFGDKSMLGFF